MTRRDLQTIASDSTWPTRPSFTRGPQHPAPPGRGSREGGQHRLDPRPHAMGGRGLASGSRCPTSRACRPCRRRASCRSNGARRLTAQPSDAVRTRRSGRAAIPAPRRRAPGRTATASSRAPRTFRFTVGSCNRWYERVHEPRRNPRRCSARPRPRYLPSEHSEPSALKRKGSTARPSIVASTFVARHPVASRTGPTAGRAHRPRGRAPPPRPASHALVPLDPHRRASTPQPSVVVGRQPQDHRQRLGLHPRRPHQRLGRERVPVAQPDDASFDGVEARVPS